MKRKCMYTIYFFVLLLLFNSCDAFTSTEITVLNESSYDLHIHFEVDMKKQSADGYKDIELSKNQSITFTVSYFAAGKYYYPRPYEDIEKIIISDLRSREMIKLLENNLEEIFILTNTNGGHAWYLMRITNNLLN